MPRSLECKPAVPVHDAFLKLGIVHAASVNRESTLSKDSGAPMNYPTLSFRAGRAATFLALVCGALLTASPPSLAQILQPNGSSQMESRSSGMGPAPEPAASAVHESRKPQSKDSGQGNERGKTAGQEQNTQGAGGFNNGLYGTGAGSNK
jgi:hypothetical protein